MWSIMKKYAVSIIVKTKYTIGEVILINKKTEDVTELIIESTSDPYTKGNEYTSHMSNFNFFTTSLESAIKYLRLRGLL